MQAKVRARVFEQRGAAVLGSRGDLNRASQTVESAMMLSMHDRWTGNLDQNGQERW